MKLVLTILLSILLCGCGYQLAGQGTSLSGEPLKVYLPHVGNQTSQPYVDTLLVSSLSHELARSLHYSEVTAELGADRLLSVVITKYLRQALSYNSSDDIAEYRVTMTVDVLLTRSSDRSVLWKQAIDWQATYVTRDDKMAQSDSENLAVEEICQRLAAEIIYQMQQRSEPAL